MDASKKKKFYKFYYFNGYYLITFGRLMQSKIYNFFYPRSVCVAGASSKEKSIGYEILNTIKKFGYKGKIFPVNPKADEILGYTCFHSIEEIEEKIDLAIVVVPKKFAKDTIHSLLKKGVKSIILITAGFKEIGEEGEKAEKDILNLISEHNARLVGPNCMGVINTSNEIKLNATFVAERPENGKVGFLSQSGALGAAVLNSLRETNIKFAHFISVGNKADINENDILSFWNQDDSIEIITMYLESFDNGVEFIRTHLKSGLNKPVLILKAGKTSGGMKAASSHTGALSGEDRVVDAIMIQFGIIRCNDLNELFNSAKGFEFFPFPKGNRIAVVTNAGGPAILAVDAIEYNGLELAELSERTNSRLREIVHPEGSVNNPVDLLPGGDANTYKRVNEILLEDDNVDAIISIFVEPVMVPPMPVIEGINSIESDKPIFQVAMPLPEFWEDYRKNSKFNIPVFKNPEDPSLVIKNMLKFKDGSSRVKKHLSIYLNKLSSIKNSIDTNEVIYYPSNLVNKICSKYNIPLVEELYLEDPAEYNQSFPVVLKGVNSSIVHKSEMNAVILNIPNKEQLIIAKEKIESEFSTKGFTVEKYLIQPYIKAKHELLIGGYRDPSFGPVIIFGTGGKYVEYINDTQLISAVAVEEDFYQLIGKTKIGKILEGVRGEAAFDLSRIVDLLKSCATMMLENEALREFDLNPVIVGSNSEFIAVDVRIKGSKIDLLPFDQN